MPQRSSPKVRQEDIDKAISELTDVLNIDSLTDVDKFFALNLLDDYGKMCGISEAAWRSIQRYGLTSRKTVGSNSRMVKSEDIDIFKGACASKLSLAAKISKFVKDGVAPAVEEKSDAFDDFE